MQKRNRKNGLSILSPVRKNATFIRSVFILGLAVVGAFVFYLILADATKSAYAVSPSSYTCQANGTFVSGHTGAATLTGSDTLVATKAMDWIKGQLNTRTVITTDSTIAPYSEYASVYNGPIDGSFSLSGVSYPVKNDAPLTITSPATVSSSYSGVVQGHVLTTPTAWRWIIQVYRKTSGGYVQVAKQALADASTGEFTIDLSDIASPPAGEWAFGILDADNGYAPHGIQWPAPNYYDGLEVQQKLVTDGIYDWATTKANADNTFHFDNSNTGKKLFRLVDTSSGDILAEYVKSTGLVRSYNLSPGDPSYGTAFEDRSFVYDQAVALFAAIGSNDEALSTTLVDGLLQLQQATWPHEGGFVFASSQLTPGTRDVLIRTGAHAIAADALLAYIEKYPTATNINLYKARAATALSFIDTTLSSSGTTAGLYTGGYGDYSGIGNSFEPNTVITWASTEHNIDIWHAFVRASKALGDSPVNYSAKADALETNIDQKLYNPTEKRYNQGMTTSGEDTANPLDVNSWGAIQQYATGQADRAVESMSALSPFKFTQAGATGYAPFYDSPGYPNAEPNVWFEGTYGVALAQLRIGDTNAYRTTIDNAKPAQYPDGSFDYVTTEDAAYELFPRKSVASTAWYVLATTGSDAMWNYCTYTPPAETPVVTPPATSEPSSPAKPSNNSGRKNTAPTTTSEITEDEVALNEDLEEQVKETDDTKTNSGSNDDDIKADNPTEEQSDIPWVPIAGGVVAVGALAAGAGIAIRRSKNGL